MARPPRPGTSKPAGRPGRANAFDELRALHDRLKQTPQRAAQKGSDTRPAPHQTPPPPEAEDSAAALFRDEVRDVQPLRGAQRRAEIEAPKPEPVPRPRAQETIDEAPAPPSATRVPLDGPDLFRSAIGDVMPLRHHNRADVARPPRSAYPLHSDARDEAGEPDAFPLPPDADLADPSELFRRAARGAQPVDTRNRVELDIPARRPEPVQRREDERAALRESLEAPMTLEDRLETGDEAAFLRPGLPRRVLTDLRRGRWVLQGEVDLHGCNREQAREALAQFLVASLQQGRRCVRVIHGKGLGSPGKLSILKQLSRGWLAQRDEILAFCQAGPYEGGSGALLVLLRAGNPTRD